jgi:hypothetical protein
MKMVTLQQARDLAKELSPQYTVMELRYPHHHYGVFDRGIIKLYTGKTLVDLYNVLIWEKENKTWSKYG